MDFGSEICENTFLSEKSLWFDFEHCEKCFDLSCSDNIRKSCFSDQNCLISQEMKICFRKKNLWPQRPLENIANYFWNWFKWNGNQSQAKFVYFMILDHQTQLPLIWCYPLDFLHSCSGSHFHYRQTLLTTQKEMILSNFLA